MLGRNQKQISRFTQEKCHPSYHFVNTSAPKHHRVVVTKKCCYFKIYPKEDDKGINAHDFKLTNLKQANK